MTSFLAVLTALSLLTYWQMSVKGSAGVMAAVFVPLSLVVLGLATLTVYTWQVGR